MDQIHSLLKRQLKRHFGDHFHIPKEWQGFIDTVNSAYKESDTDREMLERSLELSSQELLQANSEMRAIFQAIPDLLFRIDSDGRILSYKAGATTDLMLQPRDLLGKRIQDVPSKQVSEKFSDAIRQVQESKTIVNIEYSLSKQDQILFFEARLVPLPEDQIVVIVRNITERKRMEEALREAADKFRFVFENAYDGISVFEETPIREYRKLIDCNKRYAEMAGRSREELLQIGTTKNIAKTISEGNHESSMHDIVFDGSYSWIRPDGKDNVIEYTAVSIKVQGKTITIGIDRDITERKRTEEALQESELRFRMLYEDAKIALYRTTPDGKILMANRMLVKMLGYPSFEKLAERNLEENYEPMYKRKEFLEKIEKDGEINNLESAWIRQDGSTFFVRESAQAIRDFHGTTLYYDGVMEDITDRKRAEKALQDSIERYKNLTEISPVGIFHTDEKGITTYVNPKWCQISGLSFEDALGDGWLQAVHPDDKEKIFKGWQEATGFHKASFTDYRFKRPDGTIAWVMGQATPEINSENQIVGYIGTITDITELKKAEESLQRERNLFRVVIDNLPDAIYVKDTECRKTIANVADVRNMGRQSEVEVLGKTDFDLYPADIAAGFYNDDLFVIQSGKSVLNKEEFFLDKVGKKHWLLTIKLPMRDKQGRIIGLVGIGREITEQKRAMETLTLLSHTVKSIGESISITDLKNNLIFVNEAFLRTYGYTEQELIGKSISIVSCDPNIHEETILSETIKGGWQGELLNRKKDGTLFPIFLSSSVVSDDKNQPIGLVGVATDITERKQAEEALQESQALYRSFVEHLPASVFRKDSKGRYVFVNSLFCQLKGLNVDEVLGKTPHELETYVSAMKSTRPSLKAAVQQTLAVQGARSHEMIMRTGKPIEMEEVFPQLDGTTKYFQVVKSPVFGSDGKIIGTQGVQFDITERKIVQEELQKERNLLRMVIDNLPDGIYTKDLNCRKTLTNKTDVYNMGRGSEAEVLGKDDYDLFPKEMADKFIADDRYVIQTGRSVIDREEYVVDAKGQKHFLLTTKLPFRDEQGQIIGLIGIGHDITEKKRAEEALQESDEKLRNIVQHSTNLFYSRNTDQVFTYLSPQAKDIFDCEPDKALVRFSDFMTDNSVNKLGCELAEKAIRTGARQEAYELELMSRKGRRVWVEIQEAPVVKDGKAISIVGAATDITERRWAEMALQVSEKKYRDIVTWAPIGIYQSTHSGKLLTANKGIVEMLGYENVGELIGCDMGKDVYYDEKDRERLIARHDTSGENITLNSETRWKTKNGSLIWVLMTVHDVRDKASEILYYEGFVFDITERKHAEESLRESEERFRLLVENSTDIVTEINAENKYLYVSPNVKSILNFEPLDLVGTDVLSRVYGKDKSAIGEFLSKLGGSATYRYRDRLGGWHWFESSGRVYYTSSGEQRMVMVSRDITQRRKAEQQLEVSRKQLQHFTEHLEHVLEEERKRISRELHDELGQLLTILKFDLSWLKLEGSRNDANIIVRIDAMMESVNEALASVKRISKEIRPPQLEALGLIGAIQWDIDQVEKKTGLKGMVTVEPAEVEIKGQVSTVLYRVFREALTNVLRHANATHVFIRLSQRLDSIFLIIRDDGRGITKKELKGTTSLGLVGIRERLRMVGGSFTIEGKTGNGTVLSVEVPLIKKENGDSKS